MSNHFEGSTISMKTRSFSEHMFVLSQSDNNGELVGPDNAYKMFLLATKGVVEILNEL